MNCSVPSLPSPTDDDVLLESRSSSELVRPAIGLQNILTGAVVSTSRPSHGSVLLPGCFDSSDELPFVGRKVAATAEAPMEEVEEEGPEEKGLLVDASHASTAQRLAWEVMLTVGTCFSHTGQSE